MSKKKAILGIIILIIGVNAYSQKLSIRDSLDLVYTAFHSQEYTTVLDYGSTLLKNKELNIVQIYDLLSIVGRSICHLGHYEGCIQILKDVLAASHMVYSDEFEKINKDYIRQAIESLDKGDTLFNQKFSINQYLIEENLLLSQERRKPRIKTQEIKTTTNRKFIYPLFGAIIFATIGFVGLFFHIKNKPKQNIEIRKGVSIPIASIWYIMTTSTPNDYDIILRDQAGEKQKEYTKMTLKKLQKLLPESQFFRINRSFLINLSQDYSTDKKDQYIMFDGHNEKISKRKEFRTKRKAIRR